MRDRILQIAVGFGACIGLMMLGWYAHVIYLNSRPPPTVEPGGGQTSPKMEGQKIPPGGLGDLPPGAVVVSILPKHAVQGPTKYHRPDCYIVRNIKEKNRRWRATPAAARKVGCEPCKICKPDATTRPDRKKVSG